MASYEGFRLSSSPPSLSTQMPAAFFNGNFSQVPASSITGGVHQRSAQRQRAIPRQHHSDGPHLADCAQAAAILSRAQPARACQQLLRARAEHAAIQPDPGPHRPEHRRQGPPLRPRPLAGVEHLRRQLGSGQLRPLCRPRSRNYTVGYTHTLTPTPGERFSRRPELLQDRRAELLRRQPA